MKKLLLGLLLALSLVGCQMDLLDDYDPRFEHAESYILDLQNDIVIMKEKGELDSITISGFENSVYTLIGSLDTMKTLRRHASNKELSSFFKTFTKSYEQLKETFRPYLY